MPSFIHLKVTFFLLWNIKETLADYYYSFLGDKAQHDIKKAQSHMIL